jgi:hypothetical protein
MKTYANAVRAMAVAVLLVVLSAILVAGCQSRGGQAQQPPPVTYPITFTMRKVGKDSMCVMHEPPNVRLYQHDSLEFRCAGNDTIRVNVPKGLVSLSDSMLVLAPQTHVTFNPIDAAPYRLSRPYPSSVTPRRAPVPAWSSIRARRPPRARTESVPPRVHLSKEVPHECRRFMGTP